MMRVDDRGAPTLREAGTPSNAQMVAMAMFSYR
jgi:hypothetical protein